MSAIEVFGLALLSIALYSVLLFVVVYLYLRPGRGEKAELAALLTKERSRTKYHSVKVEEKDKGS